MLTLDFDIIGVIFFLWAIISGITSSNAAKKKKAERERNKPKSRKTTRPQVFEQPRTERKREARPENPTETIPMPDWFPFPIEIPKEVVKEVKKKTTPKSQPTIKIEEKPREVPKRKVVEKPVPTVIEVQEQQWKSQGLEINLNTKSVVNGMVWSEILGPPRAKKRMNYR